MAVLPHGVKKETKPKIHDFIGKMKISWKRPFLDGLPRAIHFWDGGLHLYDILMILIDKVSYSG